MLAHFLSAYLTLNLLIVVTGVLLAASSMLLRKAGIKIAAAGLLRLHYFALPLILAGTLANPLFPGATFLRPAARLWSATSLRNFNREYTAHEQGIVSLPESTKIISVRTDNAAWSSLGILAFLLSVLAWRIGQDFLSLRRIQRRSFIVKSLAGVRLTANDEITVPFTYWLPGELNVVLPTRLLGTPTEYRMVIAHELQHHRQGDTRWIYALWLLRTICVLNPAAHLWARWISETQEFACDETLVDRKKVDSRAYARCLVTVATTAHRQEFRPACATGLVFLAERNLLKRRIESMQNMKRTRNGTMFALAAMLCALVGATAYAAKGIVQDRRVSLNQAQAMQARAQKSTEFPVVMNERVLKQLNRYLGTPEGRAFMTASLQRMEGYKRLLDDKFAEYHAPAELMAVPIVESGYQNLGQSHNTVAHGAGLWQFIPETARAFGLRVDEQVDERLNVEMETDAGIRYLTMNKLRFGDWQLSLMAYNMGERSLQKAIDEAGTRDPWKLIRDGHENDQDYLARFMAALIILKNPDSLK